MKLKRKTRIDELVHVSDPGYFFALSSRIEIEFIQRIPAIKSHQTTANDFNNNRLKS